MIDWKEIASLAKHISDCGVGGNCEPCKRDKAKIQAYLASALPTQTLRETGRPAMGDDVVELRKAVLLAARWFKLYQEDETRYEHPASDADLLGMYDKMIAALTAMPPDDKSERIRLLIRETLDAPTFIEPIINCRNLTKTLQEIERIL